MVGSFLYFCLLIIITLVKISAREKLNKMTHALGTTKDAWFTVYCSIRLCFDNMWRFHFAKFFRPLTHSVLRQRPGGLLHAGSLYSAGGAGTSKIDGLNLPCGKCRRQAHMVSFTV